MKHIVLISIVSLLVGLTRNRAAATESTALFSRADVGAAMADKGKLSVPIPGEFKRGIVPANSPVLPTAVQLKAVRQEKAKAVNGQFYTIVAPLFRGTDGNTSYIRFFNFEATATTNNLTVIG